MDYVLYHGALDQRQRETAIVKFNNGSHSVLVATDLAARGLDIEGVRNIIHYHQALTPETYTHRNGRTARVDDEGEVYILVGPDEDIRNYCEIDREYYPDMHVQDNLRSGLATITVNAGKKEKLSKGDIVGFLIKECGMAPESIGKIQIFDHYSLFTVPADKAREIISIGNSSKLKGNKRRFAL